jgi:hypothetical protein
MIRDRSKRLRRQISPRTHEQWRWQGRRPRFLKIGGRVVYRLPDIEAFEVVSLHANTNRPVNEATDEVSDHVIR